MILSKLLEQAKLQNVVTTMEQKNDEIFNDGIVAFDEMINLLVLVTSTEIVKVLNQLSSCIHQNGELRGNFEDLSITSSIV